ncbi:MAG: hypothetical protein KatS3mg092_0167 [Patescibacteria group bacterium]|nr:MAG: hypothetical protein KatS3mg092_0167 [Patescibacteria group bacterium]
MSCLRFFIIIIIFFLFFSFPVRAKILINEFLIEPQPQQVEIINTGSESANLKNWLIDDDGGSSATYLINEDTIIYPNSCLVFSSNFYLNTKSADTIRLFDNQNNLIDFFSYKSSSGSGISYQRIPDGENNWATGEATLGLFNQTKTPCLILPTPTITPTLFPTLSLTPTILLIITNTPTPTSSPTLSLISYDNIFISEAMVYPDNNEKEWIEIFNDNDFNVNLVNWYIDDQESSGSSAKSFSLEIPAKSYKAIILSTNIFNNSGDSVRLLDFNKNLKDSFEYGSSLKNKTWGRIDFESDNVCLQEPSFEQKNNPCLENQPTLIITPTLSLIKENSQSKSINSSINQSSIKKMPLRNNNLLISHNTFEQQSEILGISTNKKTNKTKKNITNFLIINSIFYTFLTELFILIKIKIKYGKIKKFFLSFIYS